MDSKTYIANAIRTESVPTSLQVNQLALHATMEAMVQVAKIADQMKRRIFYGSPVNAELIVEAAAKLSGMAGYLAVCAENDMINDTMPAEAVSEAVSDMPDLHNLKLESLNVRLLHAGFGIHTESGELIEGLLDQYETGAMDLVNFGEEIGDIEWYQAIGFDETGVSEASCREKNIAKLRKRYPEKFTALDALNRDLAGERVILSEDPMTGGASKLKLPVDFSLNVPAIKPVIPFDTPPAPAN